ncbi:hypothetical protein T12_9371 [Trichinella patagoniensis]|uniref:Uncharacterized protein n=1 Tax=Trichinella patagoniensis TaxID=990121 RepID=A0A0V0ZVE3_9BILA|nr:hypothetical protein T12_9371 [Trichinella patagoniensis]
MNVAHNNTRNIVEQIVVFSFHYSNQWCKTKIKFKNMQIKSGLIRSLIIDSISSDNTLSSELLQIAKQNLLSEESVEITEEYY